MVLAFVFPGQGFQSLGMLNKFNNIDVVHETMYEASEILKQDLNKLITYGPINRLNLTINTQPAMLAITYAIYRAWCILGGQIPKLLAGHSLGEYTALVVANVLAFDDALKLVRFRAQIIQNLTSVNKGRMAVIIGLDKNTVKLLCDEASSTGTVELANFNTPLQIVISGEKIAVKKVCTIAKIIGAKRVLLLPLSAPFHSSLLKPVCKILQEYLSNIIFNKPKIPVLNNVDVSIVSNPIEIRNSLVRQIHSPVRWVECINSLKVKGVTQIIECGPSRILSNIIRHINPSLVGGSVIDLINL